MYAKADDVVDDAEEEEEPREEPHPQAKSIKTATFGANAPLRDILWCGQNSEIMLVHTIQGEVYRSSDKGTTWQPKHSKGAKAKDGLIPSSHRISSIKLSPADPSLVFFLGVKGTNWVSED